MAWAPRIDRDWHPKEMPWPIGVPKGDDGVSTDPPGLMGNTIPATALQALMETAPGDTPRESTQEQLELREVLADAMERLRLEDERGWWVFTAITNRGLSVRQVATELGISKSHVHRIHHRTRDTLQVFLRDEPLISGRLTNTPGGDR